MLLYNAQEPTDFESYQEQGDIGFLSVAGAQFDTFKYEDLSTSRGRNLDEELLKEVHKVHDLAPEMFGPSFLPAFESSSTEILKESWRQATQGNIGMLQGGLQLALANSIASTKSKDSLSSDWQGIIEPNLEALRERFPDANIRNRDEIDADIAAQAKMLRDDFEETYSYADPYAAFFGTLGGGAVASMADPINIMTLPIGAGKVAGASFVQGLSIIVARSFGIGFATEAAIQPLVYDYKKEIESPYDLQDALFNMSAAGVGNGLLNGLGHSIARGFDRITSKQELPDNHETRRLRKKIQDLLELQDFTDETGAKTVGELEVHLKALNTAMADIEAGRQVDYDSLGKTIEAEYLELFDVEVNGARATMDYIAQKRYELEESFDPDLYAKQEQLQKFADQKLTKWELKQAQNKADIETTGELNQETDLDAIREIQKADFDRSVGEDTIRQNEEANIANNDLRASRRDEGDMIALKQQMDDLDNKYSEQVDYHSAAKKARDQYVVDKAEETNQAIAVAPTDTPRMMAVKTAVNRIAASMGANDIKVRVYEGNPEFGPDMRLSREGDVDVSADSILQFTPFKIAQDMAVAYAKSKGIIYTPPAKHVVANPERGRLIAEEFARMKHEPGNKEVAAAYDAMINETTDQFKFILGSGLKIEFIRGDDPYVNGPSDVINDIKNNNHIWVYSTRDGFGSNEKFDPVDNPLLKETEFEIDGVKLLANDVFRIVHDYFGHVQTGTTFRATGEENAWQSHAAMYTPLARRAMTTETRGQNSWVNYGPDGTINRTATTGNTTFADQKIGLLPRWVSEENRVSASDRKIRYESDRRNNQTGFEGAVDEQGRVQLIHYSRELISRTDPDRWGNGLSRNVRSEQNRRLSGAPGRTYFGIEQATENGYKKELGLGDYRLETTIDGELIYNPAKNPDGLWDNMDIVSSERAIANAGYVGYYVNSKQLGKVVAVFDEIEVAPAVPTNMRFSLADGGVSTRMPGGVKATEDGLKTDLLVGAETDLADPVTLAKNTEKINEYDGYIPKAANETPEEIAINFIDQVKQNLLWLHDLVPDDIRKRSHMWYTGANRITEGFAARYGLH